MVILGKMSMFEEMKRQNIKYLLELRNIKLELRNIKKNSTYYYDLETISKPILILLLERAIAKLDTMSFNSLNKCDERDWNQRSRDLKVVFNNLINDAIKDCAWSREDLWKKMKDLNGL